MTVTDRLLAEKRGATGFITFNNPARLNAMSFDMYQGLPECIERFERDEEVRAIVLKGAGERSFVSGADISEFGEKRSSGVRDEYDAVSHASLVRLETAAKPTIAMIRGYCIGGGLELALACDLRIATDASTFAIPAAKLGLGYPAYGIRKLISVVGPAIAKDIFFTARQLSSEEALRAGLVNEVVPDAALEAAVEKCCERIGRNAPITIDSVKRIIAEIAKDEPDEALCERLYRRCFESADYEEGWTAFLAKRRPEFKGR